MQKILYLCELIAELRIVMKKYIILFFVIAIMSNCSLYEQKRNSGVVAEYKGKTITLAEIQSMTAGMTAEDSLRVAKQYIHQWAIDLIEYDKAKDSPNKDIERLVEDYNRSLYVHSYEERLIAQHMPQDLPDTLVTNFYHTHSDHFILRETILRGVLLVIPNGAPNMDMLRKNIQHPDDEEHIEWLEKFAYQYATGYELFLDEWKTTNDIILHMPFEKDNLNNQLRQKKQIELQDSVNVYLLQVTEMHTQGGMMPLSYARKEIEKILLRQRQVEFLEREREDLYNDAIKKGKLKLYED